MGFTVEYEITRYGWYGQVSRTFTERHKTREAAVQALNRIGKEYAKSEITRLEMIADKRK